MAPCIDIARPGRQVRERLGFLPIARPENRRASRDPALLEEIVRYLDWTPLFMAWELRAASKTRKRNLRRAGARLYADAQRLLGTSSRTGVFIRGGSACGRPSIGDDVEVRG